MPSGRTWAFVKIAASIALVYLAIDLYANDSHSSYGYGVKAALLAFGAAVSLFYELIPNGKRENIPSQPNCFLVDPHRWCGDGNARRLEPTS